MKKISLLLLFVSIVPAACLAQSNQTESLTFTTYYPSPYGVFRNLKLHPSKVPTAGVAEGVMYYDEDYRLIRYYNNNTWVNFTGGSAGASGLWESAGNDIRNTNSGQVFIDGTPDANGVVMEIHGDPGLEDPGGNNVFSLNRKLTPLGSNAISFVNASWGVDYEIQHVQEPPIVRIVKGPAPWKTALAVNEDRVGINTENPLAPLQIETGTLSSPLIEKNSIHSAYSSGFASLTPYKNAVHLAYGCYLANNIWIHDSFKLSGVDNVYNARFTVQPNVGVRWSASNTKSCSWNVAHNVTLWDQAGTWVSARGVRLPNASPPCDAANRGRLKYNSTGFYGCTAATGWAKLDWWEP